MTKYIAITNSIILPIVAVVISAILYAQTAIISENILTNGDVKSQERNRRAAILERFFTKYKSPLAANAKTFVEVAEIYDIDYRLLPSIACMESTCAKFLIEDSYNPFGWGIYGNNVITFESYDEAIKVVGKGLYKGYIANGLDTPEEIAPIYTPPNHYNWKNGVRFFMDKIDEVANS